MDHISKLQPKVTKYQESTRKLSLPHFKYIPHKKDAKSVTPLRQYNTFDNSAISTQFRLPSVNISFSKILNANGPAQYLNKRKIALQRNVNSKSIFLSRLKKYIGPQECKQASSVALTECAKVLSKKTRQNEKHAAWVDGVLSIFDESSARKPKVYMETINANEGDKFLKEFEKQKVITIQDIAAEVEAKVNLERKNAASPLRKTLFKCLERVDHDLRHSRKLNENVDEFEKITKPEILEKTMSIRNSSDSNKGFINDEIRSKFNKKLENCFNTIDFINQKVSKMNENIIEKPELLKNFENALREGNYEITKECLKENPSLINKTFSVFFKYFYHF